VRGRLCSSEGSTPGCTICATPPLVINEEELKYGVSLIDKALAIADAAIVN
jgi:acetylornithine/succinyldiaminopimelate/putrescine aminotransferase